MASSYGKCFFIYLTISSLFLRSLAYQEDNTAYFAAHHPPPINRHLISLLECDHQPNKHSNHIRLLETHYRNISFTSPEQNPDPSKRLFNPTILPLPYWSQEAKYLLIARVVTSGLHQESLICLADLCVPANHHKSPDERHCLPSDSTVLGPHGGLRCTTPPLHVNIPATPAEQCDGAWSSFPDIPGFHDPRIFWSGKGEPLIIVNSASQYGCVGLWIVDLRTLHPGFDQLLKRNGRSSAGALPPMSYPHLTELTRNPRKSRNSVEKNWILFFPNQDEAFVQYDLFPRISPSSHTSNESIPWESTIEVYQNSTIKSGRSFAKLIGNGYTTPNLASPHESNCFSDGPDPLNRTGNWHQSTNALRLILCTRAEVQRGKCPTDPNDGGRSVHFAIVHRKFSNDWDLPMRYERYVVVWESRPPFRVVARSRWPWLVDREVAMPWSMEEQWDEEEESDEFDHPDRRTSGIKGSDVKNVMRKRQPQKFENSTSIKHDITSSTDFLSPDYDLEDFDSNRDDSPKSNSKSKTQHKSSTYFTYTPSLSWAWRPQSHHLSTPHNFISNQDNPPEDLGSEPSYHKDPVSQRKTYAEHDHAEDHLNAQHEYPNHEDVEQHDSDTEHLINLGTGYLDDEVLIGIGLDDVDSAVVKIRADRLVRCLKFCPGIEIE